LIRSARFSLAALLLFVAATVSAQDVAEIPLFNAPQGTAALGGGIRLGQNMYLASDNEDERKLDLIPLYLYEGRYLFFRGTMGGVHIINNDSLELSLIGRYRFQSLKPESNVFYQGINERKQSFDAGLQVRLTKNWGQLNLNWVTDTLNRHKGQEAQISYRYNFEAGPWTFSPFIGWSWQDANLTNYYFGVSADEARPDLPEFTPGESQWVRVGLNTSWQITDRIMLFGNVGFGGTDTEVLESPLVEESGLSAAFIGGTYVFGNARRPDYIIDFLAKVAAFRHFEEDEGNENFWSYAAFIMVQGKGYSPWSKEEVFRYGFGFGFSYAENVPIAEQRKQTGSGAKGNTSHFLNYLELTLDFPLRRVSKAKWLQNCYAGMTVVHRSGIFGTSDILGDVSGGADWITASLECTR
jgi:outer membrane scaffolding protein for murein synthesis (MipA/OmpV family)